MLRLLEQLGRQEPLVLVLEDLHWADRSTRDLVKFLVSGLRRPRSCIVLTHRTDEVGARPPGPKKLLAELQRAARVAAIALAAADPRRDVQAACRAVGRAGRTRVVDAIHERSEGDPFSEELLAAGAPVPASLRDALLARLDGLPPEAQAVTRIAAAVGRNVEHELLAAIADRPDESSTGRCAQA